MTARQATIVLSISLLAGMVTACGEDGQSLGDSECPAQPLYHYEYDPSTDTWSRVGPDGKPLSAADEKKIADAESGNATGPRCLTPAGNARTIDGTGSQQGSGDAGK